MLRVEVIYLDDTTRTLERAESVVNKGEFISVYTEYSEVIIPTTAFKSLEVEQVAGDGLVQ